MYKIVLSDSQVDNLRLFIGRQDIYDTELIIKQHRENFRWIDEIDSIDEEVSNFYNELCEGNNIYTIPLRDKERLELLHAYIRSITKSNINDISKSMWGSYYKEKFENLIWETLCDIENQINKYLK